MNLPQDGTISLGEFSSIVPMHTKIEESMKEYIEAGQLPNAHNLNEVKIY